MENIAEQIERQFELAKLDYSRLGIQEQHLMDKRGEHWTKFFTITGLPVTAMGVLGLQGSVYLLALVPFFLTCIALEMKHDEQVLRYDVRKQMKLLAATYGFANHDSKFAEQSAHQQKRFWHGYYKHGRMAAFLLAEVAAAVMVSGFTSSFPLLSIALAVLNTSLIVFTAWCMK
jgi:hypothetical protein